VHHPVSASKRLIPREQNYLTPLRSLSAGDPSVREIPQCGKGSAQLAIFVTGTKNATLPEVRVVFGRDTCDSGCDVFKSGGVPRPHFLSFSITSFPSGPHPVIQPGNLRSAISSPASLGGARDRQTLYYAFRAENHAFNW